MKSREKISLGDKYDLTKGRVFISGTQAVIRMALMQHELDRRAGLNTAGYISGYRGSPLGALDLQLARLTKLLEENSIKFQPGLNEDLAATALWGTQQAELRGEGLYDGVFGLWYGKGPGVDRSGDVFRHANHAGTSKYGGVVALMGDDHTCESSTSAHQSEFAFVDAMIPVLNPAGVQEILDFGLYGWAMSRYAGVWVGLKCVKDNIEQTASADGRIERINIKIPDDFKMPDGGLNIRLGDTPLAKEARLHDFKRYAILSFARANNLDRLVLRGGPRPKIGVISAGKSYMDVAEALDLLDIDEVRAANLGLRLYKAGLTWPLEPVSINSFAEGLELIIVVEEKRSLIETQIREQLYGRANAPQIIGKRDEVDRPLFPAKGALDAVMVARELARRIVERTRDPALIAKLEEIEKITGHIRNSDISATRTPYYCAGCPHNSSTVVPDGSRAYAGIGCHYMVQWMDRSTEGFTQMGGEGVNWIGEEPFSKRDHVFQNLGDGTYMHSGSLAIRAAVVANANITFKLLYNDAVAMTGGQPIDGGVSVQQMANQIAAEGVQKIAIVSDEPEKYSRSSGLPSGTSIHHRDTIQNVQKDLRNYKGVSVLIYDQTCAAEKRRRRKRGLYPDPSKRVVINERVCEGCGDCGVQSNCIAILPVETEFGRKRMIDQSSCNKDYSCLKGFCPSFVTVLDGELKKGADHTKLANMTAPDPSELPDPVIPELSRKTYSIVITGIGGTGVVTVGQILGMAGHLEGKGIGIIDMSGLAQKGGPVAVHLKLADNPDEIKAIRASIAGADLILGGDLVVTASEPILKTIREGRTSVVSNCSQTVTADFTRNPDLQIPFDEMRLALEARAGKQNSFFVDALRYVNALMGDSIAGNLFVFGYAFQLGLIPVSYDSIVQAIEMNNVAVKLNIQAFNWGRLFAIKPEVVNAYTESVAGTGKAPRLDNLDDIVEKRVKELTDYQNTDYADRYRRKVEQLRKIESERIPGCLSLTMAVAKSYFKLLAYKDEYEVARLYTDGTFSETLQDQFKGRIRLKIHLAPPLLSRQNPVTGNIEKREFGAWILRLMRILTYFKFFRGGPFDPFGYTEDRKLERRLITEYETYLSRIIDVLDESNHSIALELAELPQKIRGFGHIKKESADAARQKAEYLMQAMVTGGPIPALAAE